MTQRRIAYIELAAAMMIVGTSVSVGKLMIADFPVFLANTLRFVVGLPILLLVVARRGAEWRALRRRDYVLLFGQAFTGIFVFNVLLLYGLQLTSATGSGIITSTTPALIGMISWLFLHERLSRYEIAGVGLAFCGILAINLAGVDSQGAAGSAPLVGNLLVFGAVIGEALFTIFRKANADRVSPLLASTIVNIFALVLFMPAGIYEAARFDFASVPPTAYITVVYFGVALTVLAYLLWFSGVSKVPANTAAVFTGLMSVSAVSSSCLLLGETLAWPHVLGIVCVLISIALISQQPASHPDAALATSKQ